MTTLQHVPLKQRSRCLRVSRGVLPAVLAFSTAAQAGNDDEVLIGTDAVLTGGAVTATVNDGSSLWYNPAGVGTLGRSQVDVTGTAYTLRIWRIPEYMVAPDGAASSGHTTEALTIPSAITFVREINDRWAVGFGYFLSRWSDIRGTSEITFDDNGSQAIWQSGYVQTYSLHNVIIGGAYKVSDKVRIGLGVVGIYNGVNFSYQFSGGIADDPNSAFLTATEQGYQSHYGLQLNAGVQWQVTDEVRLGLSARTPAVGLRHSYQTSGYGSAGFDLTEVPDVDPGTGPTRPLNYRTLDGEQTSWWADWLLPPRFRVGLAHQLGKGWWSLDLDYQTPIVGKVVTLAQRDFQAVNREGVFNARVGGKYFMSDALSVGSGLFTDRGATKDTALGTGQFDFYGIAAGMEFGNVHKLDESEKSDQLRFSTSLGVRYAYGHGTVGTILLEPFYDIVEQVAADSDYRLERDDAKATAHELTLNLGAGVYF